MLRLATGEGVQVGARIRVTRTPVVQGVLAADRQMAAERSSWKDTVLVRQLAGCTGLEDTHLRNLPRAWFR